MAITVISGPEKSGKTTLANTMRNTAIMNGRGCLLLDETTEGEPKILIEKLIKAEPFPEDISKHAKVEFGEDGKPAMKLGLDALAWKKDPLVIVVGDKGKELLRAIEAICPGFVAKFGPPTGISTKLETVELA